MFIVYTEKTELIHADLLEQTDLILRSIAVNN